MRNPVQEYAIARRMPIPTLAAVLQGLSDIVSMTVAHAALKEKIEAETAKKGAAATQQAQAPKVRDKDIAMARGLTSLPVDIPMTPGGITGVPAPVAMAAAGGEVQRFQVGGLNALYDRAEPNSYAAQAGFLEQEIRRLESMIGSGGKLSASSPLAIKLNTLRNQLHNIRAMGGAAALTSSGEVPSGTGKVPGLATSLAPTTPQPSAVPPGQQPPVQQPPAGPQVPVIPQVSVPSGSAGLRSLMPKELTAEEAMEKARPFSSMETVAQYGAQRIEDLAKRQEEEKTAFEKTLIDNKDLFAEARQELEKGALSSAKEKELDIAAALLKSAATVRKQDLLSGLASLGVDVAGAEKTFNKAERERKAALMNIKRAERAEEAGNARAALDFRMRANDKMDSAQNEFVKATMSVAEVDRKTALGMVQKVEEQRLGIGMEIAKLDAAAGRLSAELKLRLEESGQKKSQQQIVDALELAQRDYKNLDAATKMKVNEEDYLRQRAANYLGILKSGTFGGASSGQKVIDFTKIGR